MKEINFMHYTYGSGLFKTMPSIFDIKPTDMDNYLLCRDVGFQTAMYNFNYTKRAVTIYKLNGLRGGDK